jgi:hypothetical protein
VRNRLAAYRRCPFAFIGGDVHAIRMMERKRGLLFHLLDEFGVPIDALGL